MKQGLAAFASGALFAAGLATSGLTSPRTVLAFLDITGAWEPALALVMLTAIATLAAAYRLSRNMSKPLLARSFVAPNNSQVSTRLVAGSLLFGAGWGGAGYCPGPALVAAGGASYDALIFCGAMFFGFWATSWVDERHERAASRAGAFG